MVRNVIADELKNSTVSAMKSGPFSQLTDDTTYITNQQQCCLLVRYFDNTTGFVKGSFYKVLHLSRATGESIFSAITDAFAKDNIPIQNMIALGTDGAAIMCGRVSGLYATLRELQGSLYSVSCICHPVHLVAKKATDVFPTLVQTFPVKIFYCFKKSYQRCEIFLGNAKLL